MTQRTGIGDIHGYHTISITITRHLLHADGNRETQYWNSYPTREYTLARKDAL